MPQLLRDPLRPALYDPLTRGVSALTFPAQGAIYDLDFAANQYFGGTQPEGNNNDDGRFLRQMTVNVTPTFMEEADGSLRTFTATTSVRRTSLGLVVDRLGRFSRCLHNRDLSNAVWTKTGVTAVRDLTGRTKVANSASRITVTANDGTVSQAFTSASVLRVLYFDMKRVSGTGRVWASVDNGTTETEIVLDQPRYDGWGRYTIPTQTNVNPTIRFRFETAGDVFGIDFVDLSSEVAEQTPTAVGATAVQTWDDEVASYANASAPKLITYLNSRPTRCIFVEYAQRRGGGVIVNTLGWTISSYAGSAQAFGGPSTSPGAVYSTDGRLSELNRIMVWQTPTETGICLNGQPIVRGAGGTTHFTADHFVVASNGAGDAGIDGRVTRMVFFDTVPTDAEILRWTA